MPTTGYKKTFRRWRRATLSTLRSMLSIPEPVKTGKKKKQSRSLASPSHAEATEVGVPINQRKRDPREIDEAADYAVSLAQSAIDVLQHRRIDLDGKSYLELGPGKNFGSALIVGEKCRRAIVADLYLAPWDDEYHPALYRLIRSKWGRPAQMLDKVIDQNGYAGVIETLSEPAYALKSLGNGDIDIVWSNAVLEHVDPLIDTPREFFRVTRPGGFGVHQVDFRYHSDTNKPLDHLLWSKAQFDAEFARWFGEIGTQIRPAELERSFKDAGFLITDADANMKADISYLDDLVVRLRASRSAYRAWPRDDLEKLSVCYTVRKPG